MKRIIWLTALIFAASGLARAQIGKTVVVAIGSPEDTALGAISAAQDPAQKIALLDKFSAEHPTGDLALMADQLYVNAYAAEKNYDKAYEYGDKALAIDPDNFATAVNLVRTAEEAGNTDKIFHYGELVSTILARYRASPAPAGTAGEEWAQDKADTLKKTEADAQYVEYAMFNAAFKETDPAAKAQLFERFIAAYPDSTYRKDAATEIVFAYQAAKDNAKMLEAAQNVLKTDPTNVSVLILLADYWSDRGEHLGEAATDAQKALDALPAEVKPDGVTDEQWQQRTSLQKGLALSALGEVDVNQGKNLGAIRAFEQASPLLKTDNFSYGRNLYRWGFTLAKMRRTQEARRILTEAVNTKSAYSNLAMQTLDKIGGPM